VSGLIHTHVNKISMKSEKKIAVIGVGYVGKAVYELYVGHYEVVSYDLMVKTGWGAVEEWPEDGFADCELAVISVPTPQSDSGACDTSIVEEMVAKLNSKIIMIKSTVTPGTTAKLQDKYPDKKLVFSPEFAGESTYWSPYAFDTDMKALPYQIIGGPREYTSKVVELMLPILGPTKEYCQTDTTSAELVKYMENSFYALKVIFCNEMYEVCKAFNVDYNEVRELWTKDPRISKMHTAVFPDQRGYSGKCFPKDTNGLYHASKERGYEIKVMRAMIEKNDEFLEMNKK